MITCSECPRELTAIQVERGNKTCGKPCGYARMRRLGSRQAAYRDREAAARDALVARATPDGFEGLTVPLDVAVSAVMAADKVAHARGFDACWKSEVQRRRDVREALEFLLDLDRLVGQGAVLVEGSEESPAFRPAGQVVR